MKTFILVLVISLLGEGALMASGAEGIWKRKNKKQPETVAQPQARRQTPYERLFAGKKAETVKGLLTLHKVEGKLYVEFPLKEMNKDMLIASTVSEISDNRFGNVGEIPHPAVHVIFSLADSAVNMLSGANSICITGDKNIEQRLALNMKAPILEKYKVLAYNPDSSAVVIDMTNFFVSDKEYLDPFYPHSPALAGGQRQLDKSFSRENSMLEGIKAFRDNVSIRSLLSYSVSVRGAKEKRPYVSKRPFTALMTRSIHLLPENPMRPRLADYRIGVFSQRMIHFEPGIGTEPLMYAWRRRLEPRDEEAYRRGELVEPKQPVVYYVDDKFPEAWKAYIKSGIEIWQKAFEKIGFKNAIIARDFPKDDPEFDPENFKYTCVRYCPTAVANAMGMPVVDPRTGEIIHATVYIYHNIVDMLQSWRLIQTAAADPEVRGVHLTDEILGEGLRYVVAHEVGHTLALMHNMSASAAIPVDSLRSPSFTQKHGTTYSIMDYARNNYVAQPGDKERGVKLTPPDLGLYDYYAIKWLYTPLLDAKTPQEEVIVLDRWITEKSGDPVYRYGKQQIGLRIDPSSVEEDLGDDAVKAAAYGVKNLKYIMKHLDEWTNGEDKDYAFRQRIYNEIVYQYFRYLNHVALNIGGIYLNQRYDGDALPAYEPVAREKQRQSVQFLLDQLDDLSWINSMSLQRGYPIVGNISGQLEDALFNALMKALGNVVICEEKAGKDAYTRKLYMDDLYRHFMRPTMQGKTLSDVEKKLQMKFIDQLYRSAAMNRKGMKGTDISASTKAFACRVEIPDVVKANSRADYGDIPENMAGMFSNREIVSESYAGQEEFMGFGEPQLSPGSYPVDYYYYSLLRKIERLMKEKASTGSGDTRDYYRLMIFKLNRMFNEK